MARQLFWALLVASLLSVVKSQEDACGTPAPTTGTCTASADVDPTQPGHGSFVYNNINIQNTGSCALLRVFVDITLPPYTEAWEYQNLNNQTGELFGLSTPMAAGSTQIGGTVVLKSARTPLVSVARVECDPACSGTPQSARSPRGVVRPESETAQVEVQWGANPWWIAIHLIGDAGATQEVRLSDSSSLSQQLMKREDWGNKVTFTFSGVQMKLPLSLELTSIENDKIVLKDFITAFSYVILDTGLSYTNSQTNVTHDDVKIQVHPDSDSKWIGIVPQSPRNITQMSLKAQNTNWVPMKQLVLGFFEFESPEMDIQLPISIKLAFDDDKSLVIANAIVDFRQ